LFDARHRLFLISNEVLFVLFERHEF
jgi:hypothetical protein